MIRELKCPDDCKHKDSDDGEGNPLCKSCVDECYFDCNAQD